MSERIRFRYRFVEKVTFLCPKISVWRLLKGYTCALQIIAWCYNLLRLALTQLDSGWLLLF